MPTSSFFETPADTRVVLSGYGTNGKNHDNSPVLKKFYSNVISLKKCRRKNTALIEDSNICTKKNLINTNEGSKYEAACPVSEINFNYVELFMINCTENVCEFRVTVVGHWLI